MIRCGLFLVLALVSLFVSLGDCRVSCSGSAGQECTPYGGYNSGNVCGERTLISKTTYNASVSSGYGPNVCKTDYVLGRNAYRYEYYCQYKYKYYGYYGCSCKCARAASGVCDVPVTLARTEYHCCEGYTTRPVASDTSVQYEPHSLEILRSEGCPMLVQDTVLDCLDELGLTEMDDLFNKTDLITTLQSEDRKFTLFALPNNVVNDVGLASFPPQDIVEVLSRHVIGERLESVDFYNGQSLETIINGCFVHVTEIDSFKKVWKWGRYKLISDGDRIFISGSELDIRDACIARNGIVHIVQRPIECGNKTIARIVESDPDYSVLESLLVKADLLSFLDNDKPLLTLLAPTNQAFIDARASLGFDLVTCLCANEDVLVKFLKYHIVCDAEFSSSLITRDTLKSKACEKKKVIKKVYRYYFYYYYKTYYVTECQTIDVAVKETGIELGEDGALLTGLDIVASNGVIHELSLPLLIPTVDFNELCSGFNRAVAPPPPPMAPPPV